MEINRHENKTWIRELVSADEQIEKSVMIDMNLGLDTQRILVNETITFLLQLKTEFADASANFNELKPAALGNGEPLKKCCGNTKASDLNPSTWYVIT